MSDTNQLVYCKEHALIVGGDNTVKGAAVNFTVKEDNGNSERLKIMKPLQELSALYEQTRIVPAQYRDAYALQYIYDMISTSDYDVRQAIDSFDKNEQRRLDIMRLQEQQQANALAMEQNDLLDRQNTIAAKARRDANIAAVVGTVQRHNTNKTIKKWLDK